MTDQQDPLPLNQRQAIMAMLEGLSTGEVAKRVKVSRQRVWQWLQLPTFQSELRKAEHQQLSTIARALAAAGISSVETLVMLKDDEAVSAAVRARAASEILGKLMSVREVAELEQRLVAVEEALERQGNG